MIGGTCTCFSKHPQLFKVIHCIYCTLDDYVAGFPTILDSFSTPPGVANTTSTTIGWEGGGQKGSHEVVDKGYISTKNSQMTSIATIFTSTCHTKKLNPWPNPSASHVVIHSLLHICLSRQDWAICRPHKHSQMSDRIEKEP